MSLNLRLLVSGFIAALVLLLAVSSASAQSASPPVLAYVTRIVDGDTIYAMIGNRMEAIRYIGINTPDVHDPSRGDQPAGVAALEANHRLVSGQWVTLTFDAEDRDQFGRLLAYVWVKGQMVNALLVYHGYAQAVASPPNAMYWQYLVGLQEKAREARRGVWTVARGSQPAQSQTLQVRFKTEADEHSDNLVASQPWPRTLSYPEDVAQRLRNVAGFVTPDGRFVRQ